MFLWRFFWGIPNPQPASKVYRHGSPNPSLGTPNHGSWPSAANHVEDAPASTPQRLRRCADQNNEKNTETLEALEFWENPGISQEMLRDAEKKKFLLFFFQGQIYLIDPWGLILREKSKLRFCRNYTTFLSMYDSQRGKHGIKATSRLASQNPKGSQWFCFFMVPWPMPRTTTGIVKFCAADASNQSANRSATRIATLSEFDRRNCQCQNWEMFERGI